MRYISLFSGIGGLDRAIDSLGGECVVQVEREPYCLDILARRWPDVPKNVDVTTYFPAAFGDHPDLVVGGPPCQPVSHAGRRKGTADDRWLWGEALRIVDEARPQRVFFENPMGLRTMGLDIVLAGLTELGYGGAWEVAAAADVGAPHLRKRIFIMGERGRTGWEGPTRPPGNRAVTWQTPTASGERPNEDNVRLLRARVLAGDMTEAEAAGMLNGKSVFSAQGKLRAHWPTPHGNTGGRDDGTFDGHGSELSQAVLVAEGLSDSERSAKRVPTMPTPTARLGGDRGPQAKRYFDPARSNDLDDYVAAFPAPGHPLNAQQRLITRRCPDCGVILGPHPNCTHGWTTQALWPTPGAGDNRDRGHANMPAIIRRREKGKQLNLSMTVSTERGALSPDWVEWLMGLPVGWTDINVDTPGPLYDWESEPALPRIGLGIPNRSRRLTALGNAVVPAQAVFAWQRLTERLGLDGPQSGSGEPEMEDR